MRRERRRRRGGCQIGSRGNRGDGGVTEPKRDFLSGLMPFALDRQKGRTIKDMPELHMTEADVAKDFAAVLEKIRLGAEVIVERDAAPIAVIKFPEFRGRPIDDCIELARAYDSHVTPDEDFGKDVEEFINSHREPLTPPSWE
jgi:hypothetical protein